MTEGHTVSVASDWIAIWRARSKELGLTHLDVDHDAKLAGGYFGKILAGKRRPKPDMVARINKVLKLRVTQSVEIEP